MFKQTRKNQIKFRHWPLVAAVTSVFLSPIFTPAAVAENVDKIAKRTDTQETGTQKVGTQKTSTRRRVTDPGAAAYVQHMSDTAYEILNGDVLEASEKSAAFRSLVKSSFDFQRIGMFTLSKHRRRASREDVAAFLDVFENYAINIYQSRLGEYSGERLKVQGTLVRRQTSKAREIIVYTKIMFMDGSAPWDVNWRVFAKGDAYQVVDVQVAGIWMALEQRSQFSSIISREKGSVAALTKILQNKADATADL